MLAAIAIIKPVIKTYLQLSRKEGMLKILEILLQKYNERIYLKHGFVYCTYCKKLIWKKDNYCQYCGMSIKKGASSQMNTKNR